MTTKSKKWSPQLEKSKYSIFNLVHIDVPFPLLTHSDKFQHPCHLQQQASPQNQSLQSPQRQGSQEMWAGTSNYSSFTHFQLSAPKHTQVQSRTLLLLPLGRNNLLHKILARCNSPNRDNPCIDLFISFISDQERVNESYLIILLPNNSPNKYIVLVTFF